MSAFLRAGLVPIAIAAGLTLANMGGDQGLAATAQQAQQMETPEFLRSKPYDQLTPAEITEAKAAAKSRQIKSLVFCADPGNMPLSNSELEGFQNKIALVVARRMGAEAKFFWRPYLERGLTRETFANNECDILLDMPAEESSVLTTTPIYRSTYVLVWRADSGLDIQSLDDPVLKKLRIGVYQHSAIRQALARRGIKDGLDIHVITSDGDLRPENQPWRQVLKVVDGELDVVGVWGPFAGWLKSMKGAPLVIRPVNQMDDVVPLEFSLSMGIQTTDVVVKFMLENALEEAEAEITEILNEYGVPLVECSRCIVQGTIPSHGSYEKPRERAYKERFLQSARAISPSEEAADHQVVTQERLEAWLKEGVDPNVELGNAVLAGDEERVRFLLERGADVNRRDGQGLAPMHIAAKTRHSDMMKLLIAANADVDIEDNDGFTPLLYAVMRNHVPSIEVLAANGADIEKPARHGYRPLLIALSEGNYFAAQALIEAGADLSKAGGSEGLTPLMVVATQRPPDQRLTRIAKGPVPLELATEMIKRGADVNAATAHGITALMVAAGHDNPAMIGLLLRNGADPSFRSKDGKSASDIARIARNQGAARALERLTSAGSTAAPTQAGANE
jgi:quinoprotein dehydrogenase-associated probable ABC transporter substrate-binding protein